MMKRIGTLVVTGALVVLPSAARSGDAEAGVSIETVADPSPETATPSTPAPSEAPPAPPAAQPPAPSARARGAPAVPTGQWVYTAQYGWVWMPYSNAYTYLPGDGWGEPYLYVYYPVYGWCWISAPWVWGIGPWPYFGVIGPTRFSWFIGGWWRQPWRWRYAPSRGGFWSAPARGMSGWTRPPSSGFRANGLRAAPAPAGGTFRGSGGHGGGGRFGRGR